VILLSLALSALVLVLWLPTVSDLVSIVRVTFSGSSEVVTGSETPAQTADYQRLLFLIPAHDEEEMITSCLLSLRKLDYPTNCFDVIVVADNCSDRTANLALQSSVRVLERNETEKRGKPFAIAWALEQVDLSSYEAVIILDADAVVDPDFARELVVTGNLEMMAAQAYHGVRNPGEHALTRMAAVLAAVFYEFAFPLKQRAGLNVPLTGPGTSLGTDVLQRHGWNAFSICEDIEIYVLLTLAGERTIGAPRARVYSQEARSLRQASTQRQRWRGGRLAVLSQLGWKVMISDRISRHQKLDTIAELSSPGPALHAGLVAILLPPILVLGLPGAPWLAFGLAASLVRPSLYAIAALRADPNPSEALLAFLYLPVYMIWRLGTELRAWKATGKKTWIRTERH
jgi:cellulose synthase/poly-beta-1,6-N-acetylglucosamine synthase-like glycosyltransferase